MGTGVQRRSPFLLGEDPRGRAGPGRVLSRRGVEESAARFGPFPLSGSISHD